VGRGAQHLFWGSWGLVLLLQVLMACGENTAARKRLRKDPGTATRWLSCYKLYVCGFVGRGLGVGDQHTGANCDLLPLASRMGESKQQWGERCLQGPKRMAATPRRALCCGGGIGRPAVC